MVVALELHVVLASFSEGSALMAAYLHLILVLIRELLVLLLFIRFLEPVMSPSCSCIFPHTGAMRLWSLSVMRLRPGSLILFMAVFPPFLHCNSRWQHYKQNCLLCKHN